MSIPEYILEWDRNDSLAQKKNEFYLPPGKRYFDGNSLGAMPKLAAEQVQQTLTQEWGVDLIDSWNKHQWIDLPQKVGEKIARLIGASAGQVIAADSTSVNLFKVLAAALQLNSGRHKVLSQSDNFPTDLYMVQGLSALLGDDRCELIDVPEADIETHLNEDIAVLMLTHVNFRSGKIHDMQRLTELAQAKGIIVIWDLAHSAGAVPIALDDCHVDFAVGCGYKFLNGGPGAPSFVYVAKRHQANLQQPLTGWMGHATPFSFDKNYQPAPGIDQLLCGTPSILSMRALDAALNVFDSVEILSVREKSKRQTQLIIDSVQSVDELKELSIVSPIDAEQRASQVALAHESAFAITQCLIDQGFVVDFREPNIIRIGVTPLYLSYEDVFRFVTALTAIMREKLYLKSKYAIRQKVT